MSGTGFCHDDDATTPNDTTPDVGTWGVVGRPIGFHSFIDGVSYSVTYTVSVFTGVLATTGMVFHEFPEGIITYLLLLRSGFDPRRSLWLAVFAAALSTPLGMLISYPFIAQLSDSLLGALFTKWSMCCSPPALAPLLTHHSCSALSGLYSLLTQRPVFANGSVRSTDNEKDYKSLSHCRISGSRL